MFDTFPDGARGQDAMGTGQSAWHSPGPSQAGFKQVSPYSQRSFPQTVANRGRGKEVGGPQRHEEKRETTVSKPTSHTRAQAVAR
jgi:hypothetical protein